MTDKKGLYGKFVLYVGDLPEIDDISGFPSGVDNVALTFENAPHFTEGSLITYEGSDHVNRIGDFPTVEIEVTGPLMYTNGGLEIPCRWHNLDEFLAFVKLILESKQTAETERITYRPAMKFRC